MIKFAVLHVHVPQHLKYCICVLRAAELIVMIQKSLTIVRVKYWALGLELA